MQMVANYLPDGTGTDCCRQELTAGDHSDIHASCAYPMENTRRVSVQWPASCVVAPRIQFRKRSSTRG